MQNLRIGLSFIAGLLCLCLLAQPKTKIQVSLDVNEKGQIAVLVFPPQKRTEWGYVIPEIIPGTYMKINYERFYDKIEAIDVKGEKMNVKKKDNVFTISGNSPLDYLTFKVTQTFGDGKIWDNILACAGTVFTEDSYLLNFQLVSGYFSDFKEQPFEIEVRKMKDLYGATTMQNVQRTNALDVYTAENYSRIIDQPILYAKADTTSFQVRDNTFRIAIHSEAGKESAEMLKPRLSKIMHAIDTFSGFTTSEDYHFIFYFVDRDRLKGLFKNFGVGSALEHNQSSIYYFSGPSRDTTFTNLDWIGAHEYFHTITPLSLHSEKIHHFNFEKPDMSKHGWLYEGVTDYFAALLSAQHGLTNSMVYNMQWAVRTAEKQKPRSFTESSENIIKKNMFSWIGKIGQLGNFYERGKLIALAMDIELYERFGNEKRLIDVMLQMKGDLEGSYFEDDKFKELLVQYTYPEMGDFYETYINGEEIIPYERYFEKLGWKYYPKGSKMPSYGQFNIWYGEDKDEYYVNWQKKNELGLKKGDTIQSINGIEVTKEQMLKSRMLRKIFYPKHGDALEVTVIRDGEKRSLSASAKPIKIKFPRILVQDELTEEQKGFRKGFYKEN